MSDTIPEDVRQILLAKVYDVAVRTPLNKADKLSAQKSSHVYLKREDMQPIHSFKIRGAYNKIAHLNDEDKQRGVICASAGNHAQGVALAARKLGISALIVMPVTTPSIKVEAVKALGGEVVLYGDSYSDASDYAKKLTYESGRCFIHSFDDRLVIAGQGTIGREIIEQLPEVTHIFVPIGGGGLIAGVAQYVKAVRPDVKIIGVEPYDSSAMEQSVAAEKRLSLKSVGIFADGVAVKQVGEHTFAAARELVDSFMTVSTDQICAAIKYTFEATRSIVEPAGALSLAGLMSYHLGPSSHAVAICSGANMMFERLQQVAERTQIGSGKEALLAVSMPERPGALHEFCQKNINGRNITEFSYRLRERDIAHVMVGISVSDDEDRQRLFEQIIASGFGCVDLSKDDIAKTHVRHMIGGAGEAASHEHFFAIEFPERPNSLYDFLAAVSTKWNISLFHYRSTASDTGSVLIGFEADDSNELKESLKKSGYAFKNISTCASVQIFST